MANGIIDMLCQIKYTGNAFLLMSSKGDVTKEQGSRKIKDIRIFC